MHNTQLQYNLHYLFKIPAVKLLFFLLSFRELSFRSCNLHNLKVMLRKNTRSVIYICPVCNVKITNNEDAVGCDSCTKWFHTSCSGITKSVFDVITKVPDSSLQWHCKKCVDNPPQLDISNQLKNLADKINTLTDEFRDLKENISAEIKKVVADEVAKSIGTLQAEINACKTRISNTESTYCSHIQVLQNENLQLSSQIRRNDILISSVPLSVRDLGTFIVDLGSSLRLNISKDDISNCYRLGRGKTTILVKFVSAWKKDALMKNYFAQPGLLLSKVVPDLGINSRVYLNDNLPPKLSSLKIYCRRLCKAKRITSFKINQIGIVVKANDQSTSEISSLEDLKKKFPLEEPGETRRRDV